MRALLIIAIGFIAASVIFVSRWVSHDTRPEKVVLSKESLQVEGIPAKSQKGKFPGFTNLGDPLSRPLEHGDLLPEAELVDQNNRTFHLSDLRGKILVITFIYTNCTVATMCPMTTAKLLEAQQAVQKRGIPGVQFLAVSFDGDRDRPQQLREFASRFSSEHSSFLFASGSAEGIGSLSKALNVYYRKRAPGVFDHNIVVSLVDREGILRDDFFGTSWEVEELLSSVQRLAEPKKKPLEDSDVDRFENWQEHQK